MHSGGRSPLHYRTSVGNHKEVSLWEHAGTGVVHEGKNSPHSQKGMPGSARAIPGHYISQHGIKAAYGCDYHPALISC